jgi:hypothetical protein
MFMLIADSKFSSRNIICQNTGRKRYEILPGFEGLEGRIPWHGIQRRQEWLKCRLQKVDQIYHICDSAHPTFRFLTSKSRNGSFVINQQTSTPEISESLHFETVSTIDVSNKLLAPSSCESCWNDSVLWFILTYNNAQIFFRNVGNV